MEIWIEQRTDIIIIWKFGLKKKIDIIIRLRKRLKRVRGVRTVSC